MDRVSALSLLSGFGCVVIALAFVDARLALFVLGCGLITAGVERPR